MGLPARLEEALAMIKNDPSKLLRLSVGSHGDVKPGDFIPKEDAQEPPKLALENASGSYVVVGIDPDAPFVSFAVLGPILHWIQSGLQPSGTAGELSAGDTPFTCDYAAPGPPGISGPHRYIFLLYAQPSGYDVQKLAPPEGAKVGIGKRIRYDVTTFEKEAGLGPVLAANYFTSK